MESLEFAHETDGLHPFVGDLAAGEVEPDDALGDGLEQFELFVAELLRRVDHVDAQSVVLGRDRHEGEMIALRRLVDFGHAGDLLLGREGVPNALVGRESGVGDFIARTGVDRGHFESGRDDGGIFAELGDGHVGGGAGFDPEAQQLDLGGLERLSLRRHELVVVLGQQHPDDQLGLVGIPRDDGGEVGTLGSGEEEIVGIHAELPFDLVLVVTFVAGFVEDGHDEVGVGDALGDGDFDRFFLIFRGKHCCGPRFRFAEADHEGGLENGGSMLGEVAGLVDHGTAEMAARHCREDRGPDRDVGEKTFSLNEKDEGEQGADDHGEAEVEVQVESAAGESLDVHQQIAGHRSHNRAEEG